ncbi:Golgi apparatus membrane protein TVP23 [Crepidotus variabilis]|uniref:Golgi apparatus membrane protein TVP23 n=1 Tax=Crepidotus variabilis TaxID=179855 RepID=A0A9P6EVE3_9AGAR|nr:Golgi apparatus membrane protein TVP23 [Crepidotus variabilis]
MSAAQPLLHTIEADDPTADEPTSNASRQQKNSASPVVLTPTTRTSGGASQMATSQGDAETGIAGIFRQSAHPLSLFFLYFFRVSAISVYILSGWFTNLYVLTTVVVVVLLAMDFWNCRNVSGRTLVGLRFWNQVDEDGESYWVFESRDPSRPANPIDSKMFWIALYTFPALWAALIVVSLLKLHLEYIPIVVLALVFNITNVIGFTYA